MWKNIYNEFQGFVIAFTSDFVAKEVYRYTHDHNMTQYVNSTLSGKELNIIIILSWLF